MTDNAGEDAKRCRTVAVIGAGASGLTAVKACMEEGLVPICFEKLDCVGGLWSYTSAIDRICVHRCTISNTSKEMTYFSDFPMPKEYPVFLPNKLVLKYLQNYAQEFGILERIRFKTEVVKVRELDGRWVVSYRSLEEDNLSSLTTEEFDFIMICHGLQYTSHVPSFPGANRFKGTQIHSSEYREWTPFVDKTVLVVGIGNSACDVAMELSSHANQVYLSTRNGTWLVERLSASGYPIDMASLTRAKMNVPSVFKDIVIRAMLGSRSLVAGARLGTAPCNSFLDSSITACDGLHSCISTGRIQVVVDIKELSGTSVLLKDGRCLEGIDAVIYSTGFETSFQFLEDPNIYSGDLYKTVFPVDRPGSMAFLGYIRVRGAVIPIVELQARWAAGVFSGRCKLPGSERMREDVQKRYTDVAKLSKPRQAAITFHYVNAVLEYSQVAGVYPDLMSLALSSPRLAWRCLVGPCVPAQFRLFGPNQWKGAQQAIDTADDNTIFPTQTRLVEYPGGKQLSFSVSSVFLVAIIAVITYVCICCIFVT